MHRILACVLLFSPLPSLRADLLGRELVLTPPPGWKRVAPFSPLLGESPFATLKYVPAGGSHAALIITLLPADLLGFPVKDRETLRKFTLIAAQPYLAATAREPDPVEFPVSEGVALSVTALYPPPNGSPALPGSPRLATTACLLVHPGQVVHVTIFHDSDEAPEYQQALRMMNSLRVLKTPAMSRTRASRR